MYVVKKTVYKLYHYLHGKLRLLPGYFKPGISIIGLGSVKLANGDIGSRRFIFSFATILTVGK